MRNLDPRRIPRLRITPPERRERAAKQKAMVDAAQRTLAVVEEHLRLGVRLHGDADVYAWSSYLRSAQVRAAGSREQATKAYGEHLARMQKLHNQIAAFSRRSAKGGEADKLHATQFYVAEAELLLLEAKGNENSPKIQPDPTGR